MSVEHLINTLDFPWTPVVGEDDRNALEAELARELAPMHPLYQNMAMAFARRLDCEDVAYVLARGRIAVISLTWSSAEEPDGFPMHRIYEDHTAFLDSLKRAA